VGRSESSANLMSPSELAAESGSLDESRGDVPLLSLPSGSSGAAAAGGGFASQGSSSSRVPMLNLAETESMARERMEAENRIRDRRHKAKKREDSRLRAENERRKKENDEDAADVRASVESKAAAAVAAASTSSAGPSAGAPGGSELAESYERKIARIRKKYEKRLDAAAAERQELQEVRLLMTTSGTRSSFFLIRMCVLWLLLLGIRY
jgi:hypothetical protein